MKEYVHTVKDPLGIHARPAGLIAKLAMDEGLATKKNMQSIEMEVLAAITGI